MFLLALPLLVAAYAGVSTYASDDDDAIPWAVQLGLLVILFVGVWGAAAYWLQRAGFFAEFGKLISAIGDALGIRSLMGSLGSLVKAVL